MKMDKLRVIIADNNVHDRESKQIHDTLYEYCHEFLQTQEITHAANEIINNPTEDTKDMTTIDVNKAGIARTFQNIRLFNELSVEDNVKIGMHNEITYSTLDGILKNKKYYAQEKKAHDRAIELLSIFNLEKFADVKSKNLPYGAQRRLEIARALATNPKLLLLDEPAAGMNPTETEELMNTIRLIRDRFDIAVLLIEHDMKLVMGVCEKITVLNFGQVL